MEKTLCLAGGCFWGMERLYRSLPGVKNVTAGYANGDSPDHANYEAVCTGMTGFREAVQIVYDPGVISLEHLLFAFFAVIDPEMTNRQGMDFGSQYQTGVYWTDPADEAVIRAVAAREAAGYPFFGGAPAPVLLLSRRGIPPAVSGKTPQGILPHRAGQDRRSGPVSLRVPTL